MNLEMISLVKNVIMSSETQSHLIELAKENSPKIICGFVIGEKEGDTIRVDEVRKVITRTSRRFHFKPNWYNYHKVMSEIEKEGKKVVGEFHSHPHGNEDLTLNDKKILRSLGGGVWIIVTPVTVIPWSFKAIDEFKNECKRIPLEIL